MLLTQPPLTSPRVQNNVANAPSRKLKRIKPSMINTSVENVKVKTNALNKTKDELRRLASMFKDICPSINEYYSVSN